MLAMQEREMSCSNLAINAAKVAADYLRAGVAAVDEVMGEGAAKKYPELVVAFMDAASRDYQASMLSHRLTPALEDVADAIKGAGESVASALAE